MWNRTFRVALADQGFTNIHGRDLSPEMLRIANKRGVYRSLGVVDLTQPISSDEPFDAVIAFRCVWFGPPHVEHIPHLINAAKPGGIVILKVNGKGWDDMDWNTRLPQVVADHDLQLEEQLEIRYLEKEDINGQLLAFRA